MLGLRAMAERAEPRFRAFARAQLFYDYPEVALVAAMALGQWMPTMAMGRDERDQNRPFSQHAEAIAAAAANEHWQPRPWMDRPTRCQPLLAEGLKDPTPMPREIPPPRSCGLPFAKGLHAQRGTDPVGFLRGKPASSVDADPNSWCEISTFVSRVWHGCVLTPVLFANTHGCEYTPMPPRSVSLRSVNSFHPHALTRSIPDGNTQTPAHFPHSNRLPPGP